ncbi:hypothetical protein L218DRAFT_968283 [Marasmius fiardii PR-910]|nr:hypothetical protein L218DRAFT_968283 [Marasmius fiardii PR-910]
MSTFIAVYEFVVALVGVVVNPFLPLLSQSPHVPGAYFPLFNSSLHGSYIRS